MKKVNGQKTIFGMKKNKINFFLILAILLISIIMTMPNLNQKETLEGPMGEEKIETQTIEIDSTTKSISGFSRPFGITVDEVENMYITDFGGHNLLIYDRNFNLIQNINPNDESILKNPHSVDFDSKENMYITDFGNKKIQKFSKEGEFMKTIIDEDYLKGPATSYFDENENLYVSDYGSNALLKFSKNGAFMGWIGAKQDGTLTNGWEIRLSETSASTIPGGFDRLHMSRVDQNENIYVADTWNNRIQKFSKNGKLIGWIGAKQDGTLTNGWEKEGIAASSSIPGGLNTPVSLDISEDGDLIIFEFNGNRIQKFSKEGKFIEILATGFNQGYDAKLKNNKLYVVDTGHNKIQIINLS